MNVLKTFGSADSIAHADIRNIRKCFEANRKGRRISLTPEELKEAARNSIGFPSKAEVIELRHLIDIIELINVQISEVDKKIEEFSVQNNSPILTIPGISHFSGTSILAELGDLRNYSKASQVIKFAGVSPFSAHSLPYSQAAAQLPSAETMHGPTGVCGVHVCRNNGHSRGAIFPLMTCAQQQPGGS